MEIDLTGLFANEYVKMIVVGVVALLLPVLSRRFPALAGLWERIKQWLPVSDKVANDLRAEGAHMVQQVQNSLVSQSSTDERQEAQTSLNTLTNYFYSNANQTGVDACLKVAEELNKVPTPPAA